MANLFFPRPRTVAEAAAFRAKLLERSRDDNLDARAIERAEYEGMTGYGRAVDRLTDAE